MQYDSQKQKDQRPNQFTVELVLKTYIYLQLHIYWKALHEVANCKFLLITYCITFSEECSDYQYIVTELCVLLHYHSWHKMFSYLSFHDIKDGSSLLRESMLKAACVYMNYFFLRTKSLDCL